MLALAAGLASAGTACAQSTVVDEVIVTGSFIAGTPEDAALPVSVIGSDELQRQGSPSTVDLIKAIPAVSGAIGESNQFGAGQTTGSGNVNLRGLGATRTLVLLNGRRMALSPGGTSVDTNLIPTAAIGRIEVLKDGAAATYGSDAIGGVVNFITRKNLTGLEVSAGYSHIRGADGDYNFNLAYGWVGDRGDALLTAGYRHRSELNSQERDFAIRPYAENPQGGWSSFGNPGLYLASLNGGVSYASPVLDPACATISGPAVGGLCQFQYIGFDNLSEREEHWQLFGQVNFDLTDTTSFHGEVLYAGHDVPEENSSPSYPPNQTPSRTLSTLRFQDAFFIPGANPGLRALAAANPANAALQGALASGLATTAAWRPIGVGGNGLYGYEGKQDQRRFEAFRVSAGLQGKVNLGSGIGWDAAVTYMENWSDIATPDILVSRLELALRGLGGFNCDPSTAAPGQGGCLWFNPFSSGVPQNVIDGRSNPNYVAATANGREVLDYLFEDYAYQTRTRLLVADLVFNGELPIDFGAGPLGWAAGTQYRWSGIRRDNNDFTNIAVSPCVDSPVNPAATCAARNGPFSFFGGLADYDLDGSVVAGFAELAVPITETLNATLALRHEEHGGDVGSTTNPKVALRWQASDWLAFRASAGTTFRAPPQTLLSPGATTALAYTTVAGGYRAYDTFGNPDLEPEEAVTLNIGAIFDFGAFQATADYWSFDFDGPIDNESGSDILNALFPNGASATLPNNCSASAYAGLLSRVTFNDINSDGRPDCTPSAINRTRINQVNGPNIKTSGIDLAATYRAHDVFAGDMNFGVDLTYVLEYRVAETTIEGILVAPETDYAGTMDYLGYGSQPRWKATAFAEYSRDVHNLRWTVRYVDDMIDTRVGGPTFASNQAGQKIDAFITHDLAYRAFLPWDTTLTASVINIFDADPSFARLDLSYDPFTANPLGRYYKMSITKKF